MKIWKQNTEYKIYKSTYGTIIMPKHWHNRNIAPGQQQELNKQDVKITEVTD